jgi:probable F420-dependent oxidoreductase
VKFGIRIPPPQMGPIEDPTFIVRYAQLVEQLGFESIWTIDHAFMSVEYDSRYPYKTTGRTPIPTEGNMPDPIVLLGLLAGTTERIRLGTAMLILPQRHPIILAKQIATLDCYSAGRVTLGVGVGWVQEEVEVLGQNFGDRGRRADEWIDIMRALWTQEIASFEGAYYGFEGIVSNPTPAQPDGIPLMIGGHSDAAARRAGRRGDEFYPHWSTRGPDADAFDRLRDVMSEAAVEAGRDPGSIGVTLTSTTDAKTSRETAERCAELGAERVVILPPKGEIDGALPDELHRFKEEVIDPMS